MQEVIFSMDILTKMRCKVLVMPLIVYFQMECLKRKSGSSQELQLWQSNCRKEEKFVVALMHRKQKEISIIAALNAL